MPGAESTGTAPEQRDAAREAPDRPRGWRRAFGRSRSARLAAVTPPSQQPGPDPEPEREVSREELDRQVRDHYGTWRDQPRGLACLVVGTFLLLTTVTFALAVVALVLGFR